MEDTARLLTKLLPEDRSFLKPVALYEYSAGAGDRALQEICLQYMAWNFQSLSTSAAWSSVSAELLEALLSRSDLVVPGETFVLAALEDWVSKADGEASEERSRALLAHVRFPMIPAKELFALRLTSARYSAHRTLYQEKLLKGFQAHVLPFSTLKNHSTFQEGDRCYRPRIYTGPPWGVAYDPSAETGARRPIYNQYDLFGRSSHPGDNQRYFNKPGLQTGRSHRTPVHTSAVLADKKVDWQLNLFNKQSDCSASGLRCDSLPAARMRMSTDSFQYQGRIRYSNRLLLSCQGRFVFHVMDFKDDLVYVPSGENVTYPCPEGYDFHFVVRPEYI